MIKKFLAIFLLTGILSGMAAAAYVGVAPGVKDIGTVERGTTHKVNLYIVTDVDQPFTVNPSFQNPGASMFRGGSSRRYDFVPQKASQQPIDDWVEFDKESFSVDPSTENVISLNDGGVANTKGEVSFYLDVPKDAEPGYHAGAVNLNPDLSGPSGSGGAALQTLGLSQFVFVFKVPGPAERDIKVLQVNGLRQAEDKARMDYVVQNNGTVTVRVNRFDTLLYNKFGNRTGQVTVGGNYIEPGESKVIQSYWSSDNIESGDYRIRGEMNYITGNAFIDETISLSNVSVSTRPTEQVKETVPSWLVVMVLVLLGVLLYYLEINPIWISIITGAGAVVALIIYLGLPTYLIGVLLILAIIMGYRWL